ncbi:MULTISPECIES: hypothetical protein, partial [Pseudomonas]
TTPANKILPSDVSHTNPKTLFALFVYKSIIRFVRVPDFTVNKPVLPQRAVARPCARLWK